MALMPLVSLFWDHFLYPVFSLGFLLYLSFRDFLLPILFFSPLFPGTQEEESMDRNKFDLSHGIFFGVLIFILVAENYRSLADMKKMQLNSQIDK
jgi:hypothetical protein